MKQYIHVFPDAFFSLCLALMVASLLETIVITNIQCGSTHYGPLPQWAKALFLNHVAKLVRLSKKSSDQNCDPEGDSFSGSILWRLISIT